MSRKSRILIVSERGANRTVPMSYFYEYEDVIRAIDHVDLIEIPSPQPGIGASLRRAASHAWGQAFGEAQKRIELTKQYELLLVVSPGFHGNSDTLNCLRNWRRRCQTAVLYTHEIWRRQLLATPKRVAQAWRQFDHLFVGFSGSIDPVAAITGRPCHLHSAAVDALRFCPTDPLRERAIDVFNIGRRSAVTHDSLTQWAEKTGRWYESDSVRGGMTPDYRAHRQLLAERLKRTKYFIANAAQFNNPNLRGDQQEIAMRHFEGIGAGAILVGEPPKCPVRETEFDWEDAIVPLPADAPNAGELLEQLEANQQRTDRARIENVRQSLLRHDWSYRWRDVLDAVGLAPTAEHNARMKALAARAAQLTTEVLKEK